MKSSKKTLLWEIQHDQFDGKSFVFGTMHIRNLEIVERQKGVFEKILSCDSFACEFNLDDTSSQSDPSTFFIPDGQTIADLIPPKKYKKLSKVLKKTVGLNLESTKNLKPIFVTNMITELILKKDTPYALDEYLWHFAKENERQLMGIETMQEQLDILKKLELDYQINSLLSIGKNISQFRKSILKMTELYLEGDIQKLYKATKKGTGKMRKILLHNRNKIMANRIDKIAKSQTLFAAIGAGHLGGEKGVLRFLKLKGWQVKAVRN